MFLGGRDMSHCRRSCVCETSNIKQGGSYLHLVAYEHLVASNAFCQTYHVITSEHEIDLPWYLSYENEK
jgi:hypothetical protein